MVPYFSTWRYTWKRFPTKAHHVPLWLLLSLLPATVHAQRVLARCTFAKLRCHSRCQTIPSARYGSDLNSGSRFLGLRFLRLIWSSLSNTPPTSQGAATACSQLPFSTLTPERTSLSWAKQASDSEVSSSHCPSTLETTTLNPVHCVLMAQWNPPWPDPAVQQTPVP